MTFSSVRRSFSRVSAPRIAALFLAVAPLAAGCSSSSSPGGAIGQRGGDGGVSIDGSTTVDGGKAAATADGGDSSTGQGSADGSDGEGGSASVAFSILATQAGPNTQTPAGWFGVLQFGLSGDGAPMVPVTGLDKAAARDPVGLTFRPTSSELFVGNRHGNNSADGVPGSIFRFLWNRSARTLTPSGMITGNGLNSVHKVAFNPVTGELFAADFGGYVDPSQGGISRFTFDAQGNPVANGKIPVPSQIHGDGSVIGVTVSPDGKRLYFGVGSVPGGGVGTNVIRQFDIASGAEVAGVTVSSIMEFGGFAWRAGELYASAPRDGKVLRFTLDASDTPVMKDTMSVDTPEGMTFSPDGMEMFVAVASSFVAGSAGGIARFQYNAQTDSWTPTTKTPTSGAVADVLILQ